MKRTASVIILTLLLGNILALACNFHAIPPSEASEPPPTEWTQPYGDADEQHAYSVVQTGDGGYALAGETVSYGGGGPDFWLVRTDSSGNTLWSKIYGGSGGQIAYSMIQTSDGGYALAGYTSATSNFLYDFLLVKTDAAGNQLWSKTYGGLQNDVAYSVVQTSDGGYAVAGVTNAYSGSGAEDFWLVKTDSSGNMMWSKTYGGANADGAYSIVQVANGGYAIAGFTLSYGVAGDFWLVQTDADGSILWSNTYGGPGTDVCYSVVLTGDGGYALAGETGYPTVGYLLVKADSSGNMLWSKTFATDAPYKCSLIQTTDGGYGLAAMIGFDDPDFWFVKTDAAGGTMWDATYGGTAADGALSVIQTSDGGYAIAGYTCSYGAGSVNFWLVKIASDGGPPADCGWPVLVAPVQISSSGGYNVGDTLTARFTVQNQGTAAIHLDKLLLGGRFNYGGTLPGGGFPDFSYRSVTLQAGQAYQYEGTLYLTEAGHYEFFVAYYIANPTEAERVRCALDPSNWNTCIDLAPGLTDSDRTWSVQVVVNPGNLRAVSIEPVQVVWGADLVQDKYTDFKIGYESTFDVNVEAYIRLDLPGFSPNSYPFKYKFAPGPNSFVIGHDVALSPFFLPRTKPEATFRFTIDPGNLVVETDESDNTFPRVDYGRRKVVDTMKLKILFIPVRLREQDGHHWYKDGPYTGYTEKKFSEFITESTKYLKATYPLAETEISVWECFSDPHTSGQSLILGQYAVDMMCRELDMIRLVNGFDLVVGVVRENWFGQIGEPGTKGWSKGLKGVLVEIDCWSVTPHEIGHVYGHLPENNDAPGWDAPGYYVAGRRYVKVALTFMEGSIPRFAVPMFWITKGEYEALLQGLKEKRDPEIIVISAAYCKNGTVIPDDFYRLPYGTPDFEEGTTGNYSIVQVDGVGNVLSTVGFDVSFSDVSHNRTFEMTPYIFAVPYNASARLIRILNATGDVVASRSVTDNAPSVRVVSPNGGEIFTNDQTIQLSWEASDLDGDSLTYTLSKSEDGGQTWLPIATGLNQTVYNLTLTGVKGGAEYLVRVIASDGVNTGEDYSDGFFTIASFTANVVTPPQSVSLGGKANYTLYITSYGGFSNPIVLNATSSTTDELIFRWINGSEILPVPNGSITAILEVEVPYGTEGGNHAIILSGTSGNNTQLAVAYLFASSHDLAINLITQSKTVVGQGFSLTFNVTVENQGNFGETFTVSLYGNQTLIVKGSIYLSPQNSTIVKLTWNTSGFAKGNYTISAYAEPVPNETYTTDNTYIGEIVTVAMPGDVNADGTLDIFDIATVALAFSSTLGDPNWNPIADINNDGTVDIFDIVVVALHFGETG